MSLLVRAWDRLSGAKSKRRAAMWDLWNAAVAGVGPGDVAVDLGANVGKFTEQLARTGARVFAFEPHPEAFAALKERVEGYSNVTLINAAASNTAGTTQLLVRPNRSDLAATTSSSIVAEKMDVGAKGAVSVELVDFPKWLDELARPVKLLKVDIEGAEVELFETLLETPAARLIGKAFVETHERRIPDLAVRTQALRAKTKGLESPDINWDWI